MSSTTLQMPLEEPSLQVFHGLQDKFIIDFANGIDIAADHLRMQRGRRSFFARLFDSFSGQGQRRRTETDSAVVDSMEGALKWLTELTESKARSGLALSRVNVRIAEIQGNIDQLARYSAATRELLQTLSQQLTSRYDDLARKLACVELELKARGHLGEVFDKWHAGRFDALPFLAQCYAALDELYWGDFGEFCRRHDNAVKVRLLEQLTDKATMSLRDKVGSAGGQRIKVKALLSSPVTDTGADLLPALGYMGDWSNEEHHPFAFAVTQLPSELPLGLPRLLDAERAAQAMVQEMFEERRQ